MKIDSDMPTKRALFESALKEYLERCTRRGLAEATMKDYRTTVRRVGRKLLEAGLVINPRKVGQDEISHLLRNTPGNPDSVHSEIARFGSFLRFHGNHVLSEMGLRWPRGSRPNADWLSYENIKSLWSAAMDWELVILHLGFHLLLRKAEMMRIGVQDFMGNRIKVLGKGRKIRMLPYHPDTQECLDLALRLRQEKIPNGCNGTVPDNLFLVSRNSGGRTGPRPRGRSSMELLLEGLARRTGIKFSFHTLRRTGGRHYWECGTPIEVIADMMGHESMDMTKRYLGIEMDHMREAMLRGQFGVSGQKRDSEIPIYRR